MPRDIMLGERLVGKDRTTFIIAEIGINHNGDLAIAKKLIDVAKLAGCDAVKFQKRTPEHCVPFNQRELLRETPWGLITYMEYRHRVEFTYQDYTEIDRYCKEKDIVWLASCWDVSSVDFIDQFDPPFYKIPSALLTNDQLIRHINSKGKPFIISTGMSTMMEIRKAASLVNPALLLIAHCTSSYPCKNEELNLRMIQTLQNEFDNPVGYSGHEVGLQTTYAAVVLGACFIERHITLDRAMWGSDQAASIEPSGLIRLVRDIRVIETALGDGLKRVYESEIPIMNRLRITKKSGNNDQAIEIS